MMSIQVQMVAAAPRSSAGPGRGPACACAVRAVGLVLPALIASLLVFRPQDDGPGLPPAAGEHGPLVPEQGGHVRTGRARLGEELEEGMRQIQKVSVSPLVPGQSHPLGRPGRLPPATVAQNGGRCHPCDSRCSRSAPRSHGLLTCRTRSWASLRHPA